MKKVKHSPGSNNALGKGIAVTVIAGIIILFALAAVIAKLIASQWISEAEYAKYCFAAVAISVWIGSMTGSLFTVKQKAVVMTGGSAVLYVVLLCLNILLFEGTFPGLLWITGMVMIGVILALAVEVARNKLVAKGKYKGTYR